MRAHFSDRLVSCFRASTKQAHSQAARRKRSARPILLAEMLEYRALMTGDLAGSVFLDANQNGAEDSTDPALVGWTVFLDANGDSELNVGESSTLTDGKGKYAFTGLDVGATVVCVIAQGGLKGGEEFPEHRNVNIREGRVVKVDFPMVQEGAGIGQISGTVYEDANGNGIFDPTEEHLLGRTVYVDTNLDGTFSPGEPTAITDSDGEYLLTGLPLGLNTVYQIPLGGLAPVGPGLFPLDAGADHQTVDLTATGSAVVNFANQIPSVGNIQGVAWSDTNGDAQQSPGESPWVNRRVFVDLNGDGTLQAEEPVRLTDASGAYAFSNIRTGIYSVVQELPAGYIAAEGTRSVVNTRVLLGGTNTLDFYSLIPVNGSLGGTVFVDSNANSIRDDGEPGVEEWQVYLDSNGNGSRDAAEPLAITDATGDYRFASVAYGTHTVRQLLQEGFSPTSSTSLSPKVLSGQSLSGINFGLREKTDYTISGTVFKDANEDSLRNDGEPGISGVTIFLDLNNDGKLDPTEPSTVTSADLFYTPEVNERGKYSFSHLPRGTYQVREIVPPALSGTPEAARQVTVTVGPRNKQGVDFANVYRKSEIHGVVFDDTNYNRKQDPGEYARPDVPVYIDLNRNDKYDAGEPRVTTGPDGKYSFKYLSPGAYIVREDSDSHGPRTYPETGGGILWPVGTSNAPLGKVSPTEIKIAIAEGETSNHNVSITLPGTGSLTDKVDVFLLFDDTGSFTANSPIVRGAFPSIIASLQTSLPGTNLGFGVGRFEEYANFGAENATGRPFVLNQSIVSASTPGFSTSIQAALDRAAPGYGGDSPETDIEALFQLVTGRGFDGNNNGTSTDSGAAGLAATQVNPGSSGDVPSFDTFTADPANQVLAPEGTLGGAGFRPGALPVILLATDTGFAYQPKGETVITGAGGVQLPLSALTNSSRPSTPFDSGAGIQETITGLNALGALVIGLGTNQEATSAPRSTLQAISTLTGAVNRSATTIANGTLDPIGPNDPFYFQISTGFASTVASGVINAIQNAATNVALDITVRASDPSVRLVNHTGTKSGVSAGQTAAFDITFTGDSKPHRFDLQFVRAGTDVVIGSIPVVLGTPVPGEGYQYEDLEDGEIEYENDFGNYVENEGPTFTSGGDVTAFVNSGLVTQAGWATNISAGPLSENGQSLDFRVRSDNESLFATQPAIAPNGTLTFTPAPGATGTATVTVILHDDGGIGPGGEDTSSPVTFKINLVYRPSDFNRDGKVDLIDFVLLRDHFGKAGDSSMGDANGDGRVDLNDFVLLRNHFGR